MSSLVEEEEIIFGKKGLIANPRPRTRVPILLTPVIACPEGTPTPSTEKRSLIFKYQICFSSAMG